MFCKVLLMIVASTLLVIMYKFALDKIWLIKEEREGPVKLVLLYGNYIKAPLCLH
jgi:hypothetical protein